LTKIAFEKGAFEDYSEWAATDRQVHRRITALLLDILRHPFEGLGKPEPLRHELQGYWSRRITEEHRLVYRVDKDTILVAACRYHYR
jgi:toxin YoeB